jgi:hypothetical protein
MDRDAIQRARRAAADPERTAIDEARREARALRERLDGLHGAARVSARRRLAQLDEQVEAWRQKRLAEKRAAWEQG